MSTQILSDFKKHLIKFMDELIEQLPHEGDLVVGRIFLKDQIPIEDVMNYFIISILPHKEQIQQRDDKFFLENNVLFEKFQKGKVNHFKTLWLSNRLDNDDKDVIWVWFDAFISLTERYQKCKMEE